MNQLQHFFSCIRRNDTAGQVRHVGTKTSLTFLDYNRVSQFFVPPVYFKPARFRILFNVPGGTSTLGLPDSHSSGAVSVLELAMTPLRPRQIPSSLFEKLDNLPDLHY